MKIAYDPAKRDKTLSERGEPMSENKDGIKSNLAQVDAHVITPEEYEELPEITEADLSRAEFAINGVVQPHPRTSSPLQGTDVTLSLSQEVLAYFQARGPGWQAHVDAALKEWIAAH